MNENKGERLPRDDRENGQPPHDDNNKEQLLPADDKEPVEREQGKTENAEDEARRLAEEYRRFGIESPGNGERSIDEIAQLLSTFDHTAGNTPPAPKSNPRRKWILTGALLLAGILLLLVYFIFLRPLTVKEEEPAELPTLIEASAEDAAAGKAEVLEGTTLLMFSRVDRKDLASIEVSNEHGTYAFVLDDKGSFVIRDAENVSYSQDLFAYLVSSTCYPLTQMRVSEDPAVYPEYGLADDDHPAWFRVTTQAGVSHTVYVGKLSPSGGGYYCRYEGRDAVYLLDASLSQAMMQDVRSLMTPYLTLPLPESEYFKQDNFMLFHDGEMMMNVVYLDEEKRAALASSRMFQMLYPADYNLSVDGYDDGVLTTLLTLQGKTVEAFNVTEEMLADYGLDHPAHEIYYEYEEMPIVLLFSEKQSDDTYYVFSPLFDVIATLDASTVPFLEWDLIRFIDRPIFGRMITDIASYEISGADTDVRFELTHTKTDKNNLSVVETKSGTQIGSVQDFRYLYKDMLCINIEDYAPFHETDIPADAPCIATVRLTTTQGSEVVYRFYAYSGRRCMYTVNGKGEFYVLRDSVDKLLTDTGRLLRGESVDPDARK